MLSQTEIEDIRRRCEELRHLPGNYVDAAHVWQHFSYCACQDVPELLDSVAYLKDLIRRMAEHLNPSADALRREAGSVIADG